MITEEELNIVMEETGGPNRFITLVQMDGEKHAAYRELTQSWFGPRSLRELEPRIRERTKDAVASMLAKGNACDFAADIALYYPLRVIMDILGVENEAEDMMLRLTQEVFGATDPEANATGREYTSIGRTHGGHEFGDYGIYGLFYRADRKPPEGTEKRPCQRVRQWQDERWATRRY